MAVEKHDKLNQKIFDGTEIKPEVRQKVEDIVNEFLKILAEDDVRLNVRDVILTGSNASYNYTDKSDIDVHIIAETKSFNEVSNLYTKLYNAYRRIFESKFDITFYGIPVELYVETEENPVVSNGIYSIMQKKWVKEPKAENVPEIDQKLIDKEAKPWFDRAKKLMKEIDNGDPKGEEEINKYFEELYELRHKGIYATQGNEFSTENLVFKEIRNAGILDKLKDLKNEVIQSRLSLESLDEAYLDADKKFWDYHTAEVSDDNYIDTHVASCFSAQDLLNHKQDASYDNLVSEIMYMTPDQYFELCSKIQHMSPDKLKQEIEDDPERLEHIKEVITKYNKKFPLPYICFSEDSEIYGQEGRHRLYALGELFGWDKDYPVQVIQNTGDRKSLAELLRSSIEESFSLTPEAHRRYQIKIAQLAHYQPVLQMNGIFEIHNVKEDDARFMLTVLRRQDWIEWAELSAERYDFSKMSYMGMPSRYYKVLGKVRIE